MITEGRLQFIPHEEGDEKLTQSELTANTDNKAWRFLKRAGIVALIGAAMLNADSVEAQEFSSHEEQTVEGARQQFGDEYHCELMVELMTQEKPELKPFLSGAMAREVDPSKAGKFGESEYYVYLPAYDIILTVQYNNGEHVPGSDSDEEQTKAFNKGFQEFMAGLLRGLAKNGLIEFRKDPTGRIQLIPHYRDKSGNPTSQMHD